MHFFMSRILKKHLFTKWVLLHFLKCILFCIFILLIEYLSECRQRKEICYSDLLQLCTYPLITGYLFKAKYHTIIFKNYTKAFKEPSTKCMNTSHKLLNIPVLLFWILCNTRRNPRFARVCSWQEHTKMIINL